MSIEKYERKNRESRTRGRSSSSIEKDVTSEISYFEIYVDRDKGLIIRMHEKGKHALYGAHTNNIKVNNLNLTIKPDGLMPTDEPAHYTADKAFHGIFIKLEKGTPPIAEKVIVEPL